MEKLKIGIIGCGYWGPNLIRNFSACPTTEVVAICDANPARLATIGQTHSQLKLANSVEQLLDLSLDAVAIATPVSTHFAIAERCLEAGVHVLVEKPLASNVHEAQTLIDLADRCQRVLMVDHTYLFNNAVRKIKELIEYGELGEIYYIDSIRINLGLFQHDINVVWDLAPHDLSIADYLIDFEARSISAWGCAHTSRGTEDIAYVNVDYGDQMLANFHVNWLSPVKVRQMIFAGSRKSVVYNELNTTEPVKVYDRGIEFGEGAEGRRKLLVGYRTGDVWSPHIEAGEALQAMVSHFAECIRNGATPLSDGRMGLRITRLLDAANRSLRAQGGRVVLSHGDHEHVGLDSPAVGPHERNSDHPRRPARTRRDYSLLR